MDLFTDDARSDYNDDPIQMFLDSAEPRVVHRPFEALYRTTVIRAMLSDYNDNIILYDCYTMAWSCNV